MLGHLISRGARWCVVAAMFLFPFLTMGQMPGGQPVERSNKTVTINSKQYYVHVVQQGQTVYSISRAYGVKDYDAVVKKDIHFLSVGDTVWIPVKKATAENPASTATPSTQEATARPNSTKGDVQGKDRRSSSQNRSSESKAAEKKSPTASPAVIRPRVEEGRVVVSLLMPLYLDQMSEISTTKFDVEQRGRKSYKQFEFIQFYEGLQMGLQRLQEQGYSVTLNVVDVADNNAATVERLWQNHNVANSDVVIAMLLKEGFEKASQLAQRDHVFLVNPMSGRSAIVENNPYVVKCLPSVEGRIVEVLRTLHGKYPDAHLYIIHSGAAAEKNVLNALTQKLDQRGDIPYTLFSWAANGKLASTVKGSSRAVFLSIYDNGKDRNRTFANTLLARLSAISSHCEVTLVTLDNWCDLYKDVDIGFLQNLNYHTFVNGWNYGDSRQKEFVDAFRERFRTEPTGSFAAMGNDIILYFVSGIETKGSDFWKNPNIVQPQGMIRKLSFKQASESDGFECSSAQLSVMRNYLFLDCD